jgi:ribokinase
MKPKVTVVGSINRDLSVRVPALPKRGQTVLGDTFVSVSGGKGANQAVAAVRYGADVSFIARLGSDAFGDELFVALQKDQIDACHIIRDAESPSGVALILVDGNGDNCITVAPGANARLSVDDVEAAREAIISADIVLLQLEIPLDTVRYAVILAHEHGVPVILNPAPALALDDEILQRITILTPNATEAEFYTGIAVKDEETARDAAKSLLAMGVDAAVITIGAAGAYYCDQNGCDGIVDGFKVKAVDSTAAGDVFNGVLSVLLAEGLALPEAVMQANAAAALSVTQPGAQDAVPSRAQVSSFHAQVNGHHLSPL